MLPAGNICVYCPGGPDSDFEYSTQSYTGYEPTSMRAIRARYNPYVQARSRVEQLKRLGHSVDKVLFISHHSFRLRTSAHLSERQNPSPKQEGIWWWGGREGWGWVGGSSQNSAFCLHLATMWLLAGDLQLP